MQPELTGAANLINVHNLSGFLARDKVGSLSTFEPYLRHLPIMGNEMDSNPKLGLKSLFRENEWPILEDEDNLVLAPLGEEFVKGYILEEGKLEVDLSSHDAFVLFFFTSHLFPHRFFSCLSNGITVSQIKRRRSHKDREGRERKHRRKHRKHREGREREKEREQTAQTQTQEQPPPVAPGAVPAEAVAGGERKERKHRPKREKVCTSLMKREREEGRIRQNTKKKEWKRAALLAAAV